MPDNHRDHDDNPVVGCWPTLALAGISWWIIILLARYTLHHITRG